MNQKKLLLLTVFILTCAVSGLAQSKAVVTSKNAVVRNKPSSKGKVKFTVKKNARLKVNRKKYKKGWRYVSVNKKEGWVKSGNIKVLVDEPQKRAVWLFMGRSAKINGFSVAYYLNATQIARNGNTINFWTKMVPSNRKAYLDKVMSYKPKKKPVNFDYNVDQWEGNCSTKRVRPVQSRLYWKNGEIQKVRTKKGELKKPISED